MAGSSSRPWRPCAGYSGVAAIRVTDYLVNPAPGLSPIRAVNPAACMAVCVRVISTPSLRQSSLVKGGPARPAIALALGRQRDREPGRQAPR